MKKLNSILVIPPVIEINALTTPEYPSYTLPILNTPLIMVNINYLKVFSKIVYILVTEDQLQTVKNYTKDVENIEHIVIKEFVNIHKAINDNLDKIEGEKFFIHENNTILNIDYSFFDYECDAFCLLRNLNILTNKKKDGVPDTEAQKRIMEKEERMNREKAQQLSMIYAGYSGNVLYYLKQKIKRKAKYTFDDNIVIFDSTCDILKTCICSRKLFVDIQDSPSFRYDFLPSIVEVNNKVLFGWVEEYEWFNIIDFDSYLQANVFYKSFYSFPRLTCKLESEAPAKNNDKCDDSTINDHDARTVNITTKQSLEDTKTVHVTCAGQRKTLANSAIDLTEQNDEDISESFFCLSIDQLMSFKPLDLSCHTFSIELPRFKALFQDLTKNLKASNKDYIHDFVNVYNYVCPKIKRVTFTDKPDLSKTVVGKDFVFNNNLLCNSIIGDNTNIGQMCKVNSSFVMNNANVGDNCTIEGSVIGTGAKIADNTTISMCIIMPGSRIKSGTYKNQVLA